MRGVVTSILGMLEGGATHLGVATDHVIESFRNALWPGYKTGEGVDPALYAQFEPLEDALRALGVVVWAMVEFEADDALAAAAAMAAADARVDQVVVCTPDKDLGAGASGAPGSSSSTGARARSATRPACVKKFGVPPGSIPDWLALVGDSADGYPGLPGWGATSAATVLARYRHLERIPALATDWDVSVRGAARLAATLAAQRDRALLFRELATLRADAPIGVDVDGLRWTGPRPDFGAMGGATRRAGASRARPGAGGEPRGRPARADRRRALRDAGVVIRWPGRWAAPRPPVLRLPGFPRFACSALLNTITFAGEQVVLGWLVLDVTNSPLLVGLALALRMAPMLLVGLPAGVLADRGDRLGLLRGANATMALALTLLGALTALGRVSVGLILGVTVPRRVRARAAAGHAAGTCPRSGRRRTADRGAGGPRHRDAHRRPHRLPAHRAA